MQIERQSLTSQIQEQVRTAIVEGRLAEGERLNEVALARELSVSRTPLREALAHLVAERFVTQVPGRGFFVSELSREELDELYVVRQLLDPAALELAGLPPSEALDQLDELNERIARARGARRIVELDDRWHLLLLDHCPNQVLLDLIRQFMQRTFRYELTYMSSSSNVEVVCHEHRQIVERLRAGDLSGACAALRQNMTSAQEPLAREIETTQNESEKEVRS